MAKRKKKNNIIEKRGGYFYRIRWYNEYGRQVETTISLNVEGKVTTKSDAIERGTVVGNHIDDIKDGTIKRFQFEEYFPWLNEKGTSLLKKLSIEDVIPQYMKWRYSVVEKSTALREEYVLKQFYRYIGKTKSVAEITYKDIEQGLVPHLKERGCTNAGINISLRHLKIWFNWMYDRESLIPKRMKFNMLNEDKTPCYIRQDEMDSIHEVVDAFTGRYLYFLRLAGCRPSEPFKGYIEGNYLKIPPQETKGKKHWRFIHLYSEELMYILLELQDFRDTYVTDGKTMEYAKKRCYNLMRERFRKARDLADIVVNKHRKITLKSYRHSYGIVRVHTTGNIQGVAVEMGHSNLSTTQEYLNIPPDMVAEAFPSVEQHLKLNEPKMDIRGTDLRGTLYDNVPKLSTSSSSL